MPKELINRGNVPRPQTLSPSQPLQNGDIDRRRMDGCNNEAPESPQKHKIERTKSILKQSSKEKETGDMPSPRRENITFALGIELQERRNDGTEGDNCKKKAEVSDNRDVDRETQCDMRKNSCTQNVASTETEAVDVGTKTVDKQIGR